MALIHNIRDAFLAVAGDVSALYKQHEKDLPSLLASTRTYAAGSIITTRAEGYTFEVVTTGPVLTTAGGVHLRPSLSSARVTPRMFGARGDGIVDDTAAVQAAWVFGAQHRIPVHMEGLEYNCSAEVTTRSNLTVYGQGAVLYLTAYPSTGGFVHNVVPGDEAARVQSNIRIYDLITDGSKLPPATPGSNQNTNLGPEFAWGASNVRVVNCTARKIDFGYGGGTGGGGFGGEQGLDDVQFIGCVAEDCYRGVRIAGISGNHPLGAGKGATGVVFRDFTARRCGTAVLAHSIGHTGDSTTGLGLFDAVFDGLKIEDCGHMPWAPLDYATYPSIAAQKTGAIVLAGGHNLRFSNVRVLITSGYTARADWKGRSGYPVSGNFVGAGQSGSVGALVWGWGANVVFEDISLDGTVDALWKCARAVAFGELASTPPTSTAGGQDGLVRMYFSHIRHTRGNTGDFAFDSMVGLDAARFSAFMRVSLHAALQTGFIGPSGTAGLSNLILEFVSAVGAVQSRSAAQWLAQGNGIKAGAQTHSYGGGLDLAGGYSSTGSHLGATYDAASGIWRQSASVATATILHAFYNPNGMVGSIQTNGSATVYATSSDARLKDDPQDFDGLAMVEALRVYDHGWVTGGRGYGVFAQEAAGVIPQAVIIGDDDAAWAAKGDGERVPWSLDYSKLVPVLLRAVQQLAERVKDAEGR